MVIHDKAPDTPSRIRKPTSVNLDDIAAADVENVGLNASNTKTNINMPAKKLRTEAPPLTKPKVSTLSNPRIPPAMAKPPAASNLVRPLPPRQRTDPSVQQRLEDMERITRELQDKIGDASGEKQVIQMQLQLAEAKVSEVEAARKSLEHHLSLKNEECEALKSKLISAESNYKEMEHNLNVQIKELQVKLSGEYEALQAQLQTATEEKEKLKLSHGLLEAELNTLRQTVAKQSGIILELETCVSQWKAKFESAGSQLLDCESVIKQSKTDADFYKQEIAVLKEKLHRGETARRKLHNDLQELKGNIRVFCRVRPLLPGEQGGLVKVPGGANLGEPEDIIIEQSQEGATGTVSMRQYPFLFDKVFGESAGQEQVFEEISQLVQSALDGFRVSIFAYGQTGSGKTFTMEGTREHAGMIPRAVHQIFDHARMLVERGWQFAFEVSFVEIYNESIRDLLSQHPDSGSSHEIRHQNGKTVISDVSVFQVSEESDVMQYLNLAGKNRAVGETLCNGRSSRSHSIFIMRITGNNTVTGEAIEGILNLVDLAGSERLSNSGSTGERLKETQAINKSLSALGDVIAAIAAKEQHIPYRNSKLTYLLQNSLGGNCKTLMFVNVSPSTASIPETLCSLRFATKVNSCQIGQARKNTTAVTK